MKAFLPFKIEVISTGNELLDGSIADTNTQRLAAVIREYGLEISRATVVGDEREAIHSAIAEAVMRSDCVVVSGGLGPTTDDLTLEIAADAFGREMIEDSHAKRNVLNRMKSLGRKSLNPGHRKQFLIPAGAKALDNKEGTAPGIQLDIGDRTLFFLPGVPREYDFILKRHLKP
jgi:nicotinamide-nucleotide amidase